MTRPRSASRPRRPRGRPRPPLILRNPPRSRRVTTPGRPPPRVLRPWVRRLRVPRLLGARRRAFRRRRPDPPSVSPAAFAWEMPDPPPNSPSSPARTFLRSGIDRAGLRHAQGGLPRPTRVRPGRAWPRWAWPRPARARSRCGKTSQRGQSKRLGAAGPPDHRPGGALVGDEVRLRGLAGRLRHLVRGRERALRRPIGARRVRLAPARRGRASRQARARRA